ncbi:retrotransposon protein, putative, ty1-copia subclass [Tanacetum coccineum]
MLQELKSMFEKQAVVERFDLIQTFHACKQEEGKPVGAFVLTMKDYVEQMGRLGYVLPQDLSVGLILNGLTTNFTGFVRNYNMHNMGKTIGELHALLIEYEKGLPKKPATPQGKDKSYIPKPKNLKPSAKEHPTKNYACHHYKEVGHWKRNCHVYLAELMKNKKQVGTASSSDYGISVSKNDVLYFNAIPSNGIYEIDMSNLVPNVNSIYNVSNKRVKHNLDSTYLWHCRLAHISKKRIEKLQHDGLLKSTDDESFDKCVSCLSGKMTRKSFPHRPERATDLLGLIHTDVCGPLRHVSRQDMVRSMMNLTTLPVSFRDYALESAACILNIVPTKKVDKTPYELWIPKETMSYYFYFPPENKIVVARYAEFFEKNLLSQEVSGRAGELEEIQDEDTSPCEITSEIPMEVEGFEPPHKEEAHVRRSVRTNRAPKRVCLNVEVEEHSLGDLNEPSNYKVAILDLESDKWLNAMNAEIPLRVNGFTQTYEVDYEETFSPVADIRAIRILIAIAAFYDYEIWQMDVKTAFLNGYLDEDIYIVQPEGFVNPKHLGKVCKLQRSINGLKQALRSWNKRFDEEIKRNPEAELRFDCYCDAGFETDRDDTKYQTRYLHKLSNIAASEAAMEVVWIRMFILELDPFMKDLPKGKLTQHARSMGLRLASSFM